MTEDQVTNSGAEANPNAEPPTITVTAAEVEAITARLKGEQRTNERLRKELQSRVVSEETTELLRLQGKKLDTVIDYMEKSGISDPELATRLKSIKAEAAQSETRIRQETEATVKIAEILAETGVDFGSVEAAQAYWEVGNHKKAVEVYERTAKKSTASTAAAEDSKVTAAKRVDTGTSTVVSATTPEAKVAAKLAEADKIADPKARIAARWAALGEKMRGA